MEKNHMEETSTSTRDDGTSELSTKNEKPPSSTEKVAGNIDMEMEIEEIVHGEEDTLEGEHNHVATVQNYSIGEQDQIEITSDIEMEGDVEDISCGEEGISKGENDNVRNVQNKEEVDVEDISHGEEGISKGENNSIVSVQNKEETVTDLQSTRKNSIEEQDQTEFTRVYDGNVSLNSIIIPVQNEVVADDLINNDKIDYNDNNGKTDKIEKEGTKTEFPCKDLFGKVHQEQMKGKGKDRIYALISGNTKRYCIFFRLEDLCTEIEQCSFAEYEIFDDLSAAANYIRDALPTDNKKKRKRESLLDKRWMSSFEEILRYYQSHGDTNVPKSFGRLGEWVSKQRVDYKNLTEGKIQFGRRTQERVEKLRSIDFQFVISIPKKAFDKRLEEYKSWKSGFGTKEPDPKTPLGTWMKVMRRKHKIYQENIMNSINIAVGGIDKIKIEQMNSVAFPWVPLTSAFDEKYPFDEYFQKLLEYKIYHNSVDPPNEIPVGCWTIELRKLYTKKIEGNVVIELDDEKITQLNEISFKWKGRGRGPNPRIIAAKNEVKDKNWNDQLKNLLLYKEKYSTLVVKKEGKETESLYRWVTTQRRLYKSKSKDDDQGIINSLTDNRIKMLDDIEFPWNVQRKHKVTKKHGNDNWEKFYEEMIVFFSEHGHCCPPHSPYIPLVGWVKSQREQYRKIREGEGSTLDVDRIQKLNDINFSWENKVKVKHTFEERLVELTEYKRIHGTTVVPRPFPGGLGKWCSQIRCKYKHLLAGKPTNMTNEKKQQLDDIGMVWSVLNSPPPEQRAERKPWAVRFQELVDFKAINNHTIVPHHYPVLGSWVHTQRVHYKLMKQGRPSQMSPDHAYKLADIGFTFEVMPRKKNREIKEIDTLELKQDDILLHDVGVSLSF